MQVHLVLKISHDLDFNTMKQYLWGIYKQTSTFPDFDAGDKQTIYIADVRQWNNNSYNIVGFTGVRTLPEIIVRWDGITPPGQQFRRNIDLTGNYTGPQSRLSNSSALTDIFDQAVAANGTFTATKGKVATGSLCSTNDDFVTDCPIQVSSASIIKDSDGNPLFGQSSTFYSGTVSDDLKLLTSGIPGCTLILFEQQTGYVVASSDESVPITKNNGTAMLYATEFGNKIAAQGAAYLNSKYGTDYSSFPGDDQVSFIFYDQVGNVGWVYGNAIRIYDESGLQWIALLVIYQNSLIGSYISIIIAVSIISFVLAIICIIAGITVSACISRPLYTLMKQMMLVQDMQLDEVSFSGSPLFQELRAIHFTFLHTVKRLKEYKAFLPSYILSRDFGEEDEDEDQSDKSFSRRGSSHQSKRPSLSKYEVSSANSSKKQKIGTQIKDISVVYVLISNLDQMKSVLSPGEINQFHGNLLSEVQTIAKKTKGDLTQWNERCFLITFNATKTVRKHPMDAAMAATMVKQWLRTQEELGLVVAIGAATGTATCGTIGIMTKKIFCVYGYVVDRAELLCKLNALFDTTILMNETMHKEVTSNFESRHIIRVVVPREQGFEEQSAIELLNSKKQSADNEWMYEMDSKKDKYAVFRQAVKALDNRELSDAIQLLNDYQTEAQEDTVPKRLIGHLQNIQKEKKDYMYVEWTLSQWNVMSD
jgi:class 3 adenylate cyclase